MNPTRRHFITGAAAASVPLIVAPSVFGRGSTTAQDAAYEVVVYGGSPSGLSAAVQAARLGSQVVVIEPYLHIGGMMAAGLTRTDLGDEETTGGLCREFFARVAKYYETHGVRRERYYDFEPHVAGIVWREMLEETGRIVVIEHTRLTRLEKDGATLKAIWVRQPDGGTRRIAGKVFVDATYEGDLAAMAGAPYRLGREEKSEFREPHGQDKPDRLLQAYCFRLTVTDDPGNRVTIRKPVRYHPEEFELLARYVNEKDITRFVPDCLYAREKTRGKADGNAQWRCWVSTDWASFHHDYPEGTWERRQEIYEEYKRRTLGWFYFLQHDPSVPEVLREDALRWGLPKDEYRETEHIPFMPYVREARRIMGDHLFTELDATRDTIKPDSIGCGGYPIDSHHVTDYHPGILHLKRPPGNVQIPVRKGYQIPYRILLPRKLDNVLVSLCVSSTHLGYCTLRMEPEYIKMGQAAGVAAYLSHAGNTTTRRIDVLRLQDTLRKAGAILNTRQ